LAALSNYESWLYQDGAKATKSAYSSKIEELRKTGDPIVKRFNEHTQIPEALASFVNTLNGYEQMLLSNEPNLAHITPEERKPILDLIQKNRTTISNTATQSQTWHRDEDPKVTCQEINNEHEKFVNTAKPVVNKPKPAPPKEEPKKPEPTAEQPKSEPEKAESKPEAPKGEGEMEIEE